MDDKDIKIKELEEEIEVLKQRLNKYTNPERIKKYKEKNREKVLEYAREYQRKRYHEKKNSNKI